MPTLVANQDTWFALSCSLIKATIIIRINNWKYNLSCYLIVAFVAASGKFCNLKWTYFAYPLFCFFWYYFNWLLDFVFIAELSVWLLTSPAQSVQLLHQTCRTVHKGETSSILLTVNCYVQCNTYVALASMVTATLCVRFWLDVYFSKPRKHSTPHKPEVCQTWIMTLCTISDTM